MTDSPTGATSLAWRAVRYETPVVAANGQAVGIVREMLGSDAEDIFHGIRVGLNSAARDVMLSANLVTALTAERIETSLSAAEFESLPTYADEATYHLASVGWLRKHLGWTKDSGKDQEPG